MSKSVQAYTKELHGNEVLQMLQYMIRNECSLLIPTRHIRFRHYRSSKPLYYRIRGGLQWLILNHKLGSQVQDLSLLLKISSVSNGVKLLHSFYDRVVEFKESLETLDAPTLGIHEEDLKNAGVIPLRPKYTAIQKLLMDYAVKTTLEPTRVVQPLVEKGIRRVTAKDDEQNLGMLYQHIVEGKGPVVFKQFYLTERGYEFLFNEIVPVLPEELRLEYTTDFTLRIYDAPKTAVTGSRIARETKRRGYTGDMETLSGDSSAEGESKEGGEGEG